MLVDAEHLAPENRKLRRLLRDVNFRLREACMEDVKASAEHGLPPAMLAQLASASWIDRDLNVLITGAPGVGKSYLAYASGQLACRSVHRTAYYRLPRLLETVSLSKAEGTYSKLRAKLAKVDVLILDDVDLGKLRDAQRHDLYEMLSVMNCLR